MILLLVSSKSMDFEPVVGLSTPPLTQPPFRKEARLLNERLKELSLEEIRKLMKISEKLAVQTRERIEAFSNQPGSRQTRAACLAFTGDVYDGLDARAFDPSTFERAQDHLRILSGLYGILRPLDRIQAYRLEPGYRWAPTDGAASLSAFWKAKITDFLRADLTALPESKRVIVDLASKEFTAMIDFKSLGVPVITPKFYEEKGGKLKMVTLYTKRARGALAAHLLKEGDFSPASAHRFSEEGYCFDHGRSSQGEWVFTR